MAEDAKKPEPGANLAPKVVYTYTVDIPARMLIMRARGPLDVADTVVAMSYAQLKFVAGQLVMQEGMQETKKLAGEAGIIAGTGGQPPT